MSGNKIKAQFYRQPRYYNSFSCIGGSCPMSCCLMWRVDWTSDEVEKLKNADCSEELRTLIDNSFAPSDSDGKKLVIKMDEKKRCPFLTNDNFCSIQRELGAEYLSHTCTVYPRTATLSGNVILNSCNLSCYRIMDILCNDSECMILENYRHTAQNSKIVAIDSDVDIMNHPQLKYRNQIFELFYDIISDKSYSIETAVVLGALAAQNLDKNIALGKINSIPEIISGLSKQIKDPIQIKKLEELKPNYSIKLGFAKKLNEIVLKTNMIDNICENGVLSAEKFDDGIRKFNYNFANRSFALRNIALNLLLELKIPFRNKDYSIFENYCYYAAAVASVKLTAAAVFVKDNIQETMAVAQTYPSAKSASGIKLSVKIKTKKDSELDFKASSAYISRFFAHNDSNVKLILDMYKELNCMSPAYIALILK